MIFPVRRPRQDLLCATAGPSVPRRTPTCLSRSDPISPPSRFFYVHFCTPFCGGVDLLELFSFPILFQKSCYPRVFELGVHPTFHLFPFPHQSRHPGHGSLDQVFDFRTVVGYKRPQQFSTPRTVSQKVLGNDETTSFRPDPMESMVRHPELTKEGTKS